MEEKEERNREQLMEMNETFTKQIDAMNALSSPEPDFKHNGLTFSGCLRLHWLIVTGQTDELVRRKREIVPALLSHTCKCDGVDKVRLKLKMIEV